MLKEIYIENLAVIEKCGMNFCAGFNVFTGETGAGKSILISGIKAILGGRVSKDFIRSGAEKALVTAVFTDISGKVSAKLTEQGFEAEDEIILNREIGADGKSTARINGRPVPANTLREIASELIDIHGQRDSQTLTDTAKQRELIDNCAGADFTFVLKEYESVFKRFSELSRKIKRMQTDESVKTEKINLLREKTDDISRYKLTRGEEQETAVKLKALQNAKEIQRNLSLAQICISGSENEKGAADLIRQCRTCLKEAAEFLPGSGALIKRLESAEIELNDIKDELSALDSDNFDAEQTAMLEERMSDLLHLKRKYKLDIDEIISAAEKWRDELAELEYSEDITEKLIAERKDFGFLLKKSAGEITAIRRKTAEKLAADISEELVFLDMPHVRLFFDIKQEKVTVTGMDGVEIMISVNKGEEPKPLAKIASGGELSRIMLAIKAVLAASDSIPTMIFDEIDTGISGRAAQKVGSKLNHIAQSRQVLCVTHLASIAAKADKHLLIEKSDDGSRTYTKVTDLDYEARKRELARIISGEEDENMQNYAETMMKM
ncbi:MAG: DNA repair protein RecN [Oscillospiraceae bacterium]|nr:DNA repair protein RecN [Oscillospiraceae bacterium]